MPPPAPPVSALPAPADDPSLADGAAVALALGCDADHGLASAEAARRLARDGPNQLRAAPRPAAWRRVLAPLWEPLSLLLLAAAALSAGVWALQGAEGWPVDSVVILAVVALNTAIGAWQQARADQAVAALARLTAAHANVMRDGRAQRVASADLVVGDLLLLTEGDAVAADARLLQAVQLRTLESSLTGESESVAKAAAALPAAAALGDRRNMVWQGTAVVQGRGRGVVTATGMATQMGAIAGLLAATPSMPTPLQTEVARLGRLLGIAALGVAASVVALLAAVSHWHSAADALPALLLGVSLAVAAVPEGLAAILSVVLALGVMRMARQHAVVKQLAAVETLGAASVIATDKTGTLTRGEMTVVQLVTASGEAQLTGVGYAPGGQLQQGGQPLAAGSLQDEVVALLGSAVLACNARVLAAGGGWVVQGDPTEAALVVADAKLGALRWPAQRHTRIGELAFTPERRRMSTLQRDHQRADAPLLVTKGAPDALLARCSHQQVGAEALPLDDAARARINADVARLSGAALRTLGVASRVLREAEGAAEAGAPHHRISATLEKGLCWLGLVGMMDPPRAEAAAAIAQAQRAGIRMVMITGDHPHTALRIAADLGIVAADAPVLTGAQIEALDDAALAEALRHTAVLARVAPAHKLRIVAALQAGGAVVAMTGDGVNDAPALKAADIGVAMGLTGSEVSQQAARMILADDNLATLVHAVREGRGVFDNIRKFLRYLLSSNLGEVLTVLGGVLGAGWLGLVDPTGGGAVVLPLLATQVLWINLVTDSGPALAMGVDPIAPGTMARPPRPRSARVIDGPMALGVLQGGVVMAALTLLTLDLFLPGGLLPTHWRPGTGSPDGGGLALARTAAFTTLVFAQLFNCFASRSPRASALRGLWSNQWLWAAVGLSVALQVAVVELPWLNLAFGTVPLDMLQWGVCLAMASGVLLASETSKLLQRRLRR